MTALEGAKVSNVVDLIKHKQDIKEEQADIICEHVTTQMVETLQKNYNFNIDKDNFITNIAWVVKFIEVVVADEIGLENALSKELKEA